MKILSWPNHSLTLPCEKVISFDAQLVRFLDRMKDSMIEENGMGLAAPQVGINLQFFLMKDNKGDIVEIINPEILESEGEQYEDEGCLSFSGVTVKIQRSQSIHFRYQSKDGETHESVAFGREAICFQHEFDHLQGITIYDKVNRKERKRIDKEFR